ADSISNKIMKNLKTLFFILAVLCSFNSARGQSGILEKKISVDYKDVRLKQVIDDLSKKYHLRFSYANEQVPLNKKVTLKAVDQPVRAVVEQLLKPLGLTYVVTGNQLVIKQ